MKKLYWIILILLMGNFTLKSQDETATGELIIWVKNNGGGAEIKIELQLVSSLCWDAWVDYPDLHNITNQYNGSSQTTQSNNDLNWEGCWSYPGYQHAFGLGLYKVTAYQKINNEFEQKDFFYINYRTSDLPENFNSGGQGDLGVDFNVGHGVFYYYNTQNLFPQNTSIWEQKAWIDSLSVELEPLEPENFQLSAGSSIQLSWSHSSNTDHWRTGYAIYRSVVGGCGTAAGSFTKIATLSASATSYTDNNFSSGGTLTAYYKVATINGTRESEFTPTLNACVQVGMQKLRGEESVYTYNLSQNFPNPFNPATYISFTLEENSFVSLKVYDILGREIVTLVEGYKEAGNHSIEFNAEGIESGIYFYEIKAGKFRDVRKLILLK